MSHLTQEAGFLALRLDGFPNCSPDIFLLGLGMVWWDLHVGALTDAIHSNSLQSAHTQGPVPPASHQAMTTAGDLFHKTSVRYFNEKKNNKTNLSLMFLSKDTQD